MNAKERIRFFEEDSSILEAIANQYAQGSKEYAAIKHAAIALWYVMAEDHERFRNYVTRLEGDLTPEQRAHLVAMGLKPDSDTGSDDAS